MRKHSWHAPPCYTCQSRHTPGAKPLCTCANGLAATGAECGPLGVHHCVACSDGYTLDGQLCTVTYTSWFNRDSQNGLGDNEALEALPVSPCGGAQPLAARCERSDGVASDATGQSFQRPCGANLCWSLLGDCLNQTSSPPPGSARPKQDTIA